MPATYTNSFLFDQDINISGITTINSSKTLTDQSSGFGQAVVGQTGSAANITTVSAGIVTVTGLTGMTPQSAGRFLDLGNTATLANSGTFLITDYVSATSVKVANSSGVASDANNGTITWKERNAYSLQDDNNFHITDRGLIKGVGYDQAIPTYFRPSATATAIPKNLNNLISLDSRAFLEPRNFIGATVAATNTSILVSSGTFTWATTTNRLGLPATPSAESDIARFVTIFAPGTLAELEVLAGPQIGERIFGLWDSTVGGVSGASAQLVFYSAPKGGDAITGRTAYTWEAGQPTTIDLSYGFRVLMSNITDTAFMVRHVVGLGVDADMSQDINDIQSTIGISDGETSLAGHLTNTGANYLFNNLGTVTPSVVTALNTLNAQVGDRTYTGSIITSGQTIVASLQALASAIAGSSITRTIERITSDITVGTSHLLPGGLTYTLDGTGNGNHLILSWQGLLRHPGTLASFSGNEYDETDTTHFTPHKLIPAFSAIDYEIKTT